jgi:arylsulfatase A-like enzyme
MKPCILLRDEEIIEQPVVQKTLTERYTAESVKFIRDNRNGPFFLYLSHTMPHTPLHVSDTFKGKSKRGLYGDVVRCLDWSTGEILRALRKNGIDRNTLVVFTSDNGPWLLRGKHGGKAFPLRSGKCTTFEGGMRVPGIMRWPGHIPEGSVCPEIATTMDLLPTFARLAGGTVPDDRIIDGRDIWPLMAGIAGAKTPHEAFYYYKKDVLKAVRSGKWKLMVRRMTKEEYPYRWPGMARQGWKDEVIPEALYDLEADISETTNVIDKHPEVAKRLRQLLETMRADLGDWRTGRPGANRRPPGTLPSD